MKKSLYLILLFLIASCSTKKEVTLDELTRQFVDLTNSMNAAKLDSLIALDFKLISDSAVYEKSDFLESVLTQRANHHVEIIELELENEIVRTTEHITNDAINIMGLEPIKRKREYRFNSEKKIQAIYILELVTPEEIFKLQKYLVPWAQIEFPEMIKKVAEKVNNEEDFDEETRFLLTRLKNAGGMEVLDSVKVELDNRSQAANQQNSEPTAQRSRYIQPSSSFLNSKVVTYFGQNAFPFGERSVQEFKNAVASTVMSNGRSPEILGWTKSDNIYTLHTKFKEGDVQFIFEHMMNYNGEVSGMRGKVEGLPVDGVNMYRFVPSLTR